MAQLQNRVAIITGGGEGIGRGIARRFAAEGARVVVADVNADLGTATAATIADDFGVATLALATDVRDKSAVHNMVDASVERFGAVDILVNNAWGGGNIGRVEQKTDDAMTH